MLDFRPLNMFQSQSMPVTFAVVSACPRKAGSDGGMTFDQKSLLPCHTHSLMSDSCVYFCACLRSSTVSKSAATDTQEWFTLRVMLLTKVRHRVLWDELPCVLCVCVCLCVH